MKKNKTKRDKWWAMKHLDMCNLFRNRGKHYYGKQMEYANSILRRK